MKNLDNPEYMDVILDCKESLEDAFAEISQQEVMRKMQDAKMTKPKYHVMQKLLYLTASWEFQWDFGKIVNFSLKFNCEIPAN